MLPCRAVHEVPKICSQIMKWRNHICNGSSHQQTHHPFFNQRTSRTHFSPLKPEEQCLKRSPKKEQKTSLYPSIAFPPSNKTSKRTSQTPILTTKLVVFFFSLTAFLSWLRLSIYMAIVSIAILLSFHLKLQPSALEKQFALPLGIIFWVCIYLKLAIHCFLCCYVLTEKNKKKTNVVAGFGMHYIWIE